MWVVGGQTIRVASSHLPENLPSSSAKIVYGTIGRLVYLSQVFLCLVGEEHLCHRDCRTDKVDGRKFLHRKNGERGTLLYRVDMTSRLVAVN